MKRVVIIGAGVMGTAMAMPFCDRGWHVTIVGSPLDDEIIAEIKKTGRHGKLGITLPKSARSQNYLEWSTSLHEDIDLILIGVASAGIAWVISALRDNLKKPVPILMITKGMMIEGDNLVVLPDVVQNALRERFGNDLPVAAIAGPCIAGELAARRQTGTVIVSRDIDFAQRLVTELATDYYHPRASSDMAGVEICAAFKNFFAIAVGYAHGQLSEIPNAENKALNNNAAAVLFDQSIRELMILSLAHGGSPASVWGMPGAGDLYVTCMAGRNSRLGHQLGKGLTYAEVKAGPLKDDTIEGAELGLAVGKILRTSMRSGKFDESALPLTSALLDALLGDQILSIPWAKLH